MNSFTHDGKPLKLVIAGGHGPDLNKCDGIRVVQNLSPYSQTNQLEIERVKKLLHEAAIARPVLSGIQRRAGRVHLPHPGHIFEYLERRVKAITPTMFSNNNTSLQPHIQDNLPVFVVPTSDCHLSPGPLPSAPR